MVRIIYIGLFLFFAISASGQIVITEYCSSNENVVEDVHGKTSDWIEIHNTTSSSVNLESFTLSDDVDNLEKWTFPDITVSAHGYLLVFCSGESMFEPELHTNFELAQSGEEVLLSNPQGEIISLVYSDYIPTDQSYATYSGQYADFLISSEPTPGYTNEGSTGLFYSHFSGYYDAPFELKIYSPNPGSSIHFTRNGEIPSSDNPTYSTPIEMRNVSEQPYTFSSIPTTPLDGAPNFVPWMWKEPSSVYVSNIYRAGVFSGDSLTSNIVSMVYFVDPEMEERYNYPVISIITDSLNLFSQDSGIYVPGAIYGTIPFNYYPVGNFSQDGPEWERKMHINFFTSSGTPVFETDAGMRIRGWGSAGFSQKSLNIYFRKEYGLNKIEKRLFSYSTVDKYKRLVLRNGGNDFPDMHFRDSYLSRVIEDLNIEVQGYEPIILFINGEYWGIHNMREKIDRHHFKYKYNLPEYEINVLTICGAVEEGSNASYTELIAYIESHNLATDDAYAYVRSKLDIASTIDYNIAEIYFANYDWPCNNNKIWNTNLPGSKWKYIIHDLDYSLGFNEYCTYETNSMEHAVSTESGWPHCDCSSIIFRSLLKNEAFVKAFLERFEYCLNHVFTPERMNHILDQFEEEFSSEIEEHIARFGFPKSVGEWYSKINHTREFINKRPCYMRMYLQEYFNLDSSFTAGCIDDLPGVHVWEVFPNPSSGNFFISNRSGFDLSEGVVQIFNSMGQIVFKRKNIEMLAGVPYHIVLNNIAQGIYVIHISDKNQKATKKMLILRD